MAAPVGNKFALGNNGGRPPMYASAEELIAKIDEYFTYCLGDYHEEEKEREEGRGKTKKAVKYKVQVCDRPPERPMWTSLALFLGFESRQALNYYGEQQEFLYPIKRAKMVIEREYEEALLGMSTSGAIFALKNFEWVDKREIESKNIGRTVVRPQADGSIIIEEEDEPENA